MASHASANGLAALLPRPSSELRRDAVWITGVGTATPLGATYDRFADQLLAGHSGVRPAAAPPNPVHLKALHGESKVSWLKAERISIRLELPGAKAGQRDKAAPKTAACSNLGI